MSPDQIPLGERVFLSGDVARLAGVSLRQLQWWDERKVISPRIEDRRRVYTTEQLLEILTVATLRRKGLSLQKVRKVLRLLRRELAREGSRAWSSKSKLYLVRDGISVSVDDQPERVLNRIVESRGPMYLVCLSDQAKRINSAKVLPRYRTKQLQLFEG